MLDVLNNDCYNPACLAREQVGRSLLRLRVKERKVRTLQGSEPANGGASAPGLSETIASIAFGSPRAGDDKCNRKETSQRTTFALRGKGLSRVMGETVRPLEEA